ncbi:MAG TPA: hypothetical protein VGV17_06480 [Bosea sp. (in: a-proteobacteria)]|jgi:hypothetical protein|uniref:hypothetical protein n=1 Tax=Bosea sp. (in: a-proteobacteria) TaxID=1871050 RepID=UPI002DDC8FA4|nr:hypothetical protein [Bosea sp. (in: a-proteobacteria)]HEV2553383.1 hypothetical protein [Bosea sp. (in: a-proteobacteria)]
MGDFAALRRLTIIGERMMERAENDAVALIDEHDDPSLCCYVATGLLGAALEELQGGASREAAVATLRAALASFERLDS